MAQMADDELVLTVGPVAHGGHCVARIPEISDDGQPNTDAGRVVFVRHALPGEKVLARITDKGKIWRADAIAILENSSLDRVSTTWPEAGPDGVGGGELAHVSPDGQRRWKAAVVAEQMRRLAGVDVTQVNPDLAVSAVTLGPLHHKPYRAVSGPMGELDCGNTSGMPSTLVGVEPALGGEPEGGYRTRIDLLVDDEGQAGMRQTRSHEIIPLTDMPLATDELRAFARAKGVWIKRWKPGSRLTVIAPANSMSDVPDSQPLLLIDGEPQPRPDGSTGLVERVTVGGRTFTYQLAPNGFWQVHTQAPRTLVEAVMAAAGDLEARRVLELYSGAGLFTLPLAVAIGSHGKLVTVEGSKPAVEFAKQNLANLKNQLGPKEIPKIEQLAGSAHRVLAQLLKAKPRPTFNLIILDPPREGLDKGMAQQLAEFEADKIIYVSCDPAALARDTSRLAEQGFHLTNLRAFDLFPSTHHVESVATLRN